MDSKNNVIVNVHVEPANINDVTPVPTILKEIENRLGHLPDYMGFDAGYHNAAIAHLLENNQIQGVIGYRRHTHAGEHYGKYRFKYDYEHDVYICPEKQYLYWRTTTREGYRQYFSDTVPGETNVSQPAQAEGWWSVMYGRILWMISYGLRKQRTAGACIIGENRQLKDPLRRQKKTMASAMPACSESGTCGNSAS